MLHVSSFMFHKSWSNAILHIDGDAFFASCEQALHPEYRGKPVVTGKERGIAAAFSYEAKRAGVTRGMRLFEVKKVCPEAIIIPSDYEVYSLFSKRMFSILKRFTPTIEEYSIDEGFADLTGLRRPLNMSYFKIAEKIKYQVETELGISVSVGLSLSKTLAKASSNFRKPNGLTVVSGRFVEVLLGKIPLGEVWGIGPATTAYLGKLGIKTALDFAKKSEEFVKNHLTKPGVETWQELNGEYIYKVDPNLKESYQSISKVKTFTPPSRDKTFIYAMLIRNLESACIKARRYNLAAKKVYIILRTQDFHTEGFEIKLNRASVYPIEIAPLIKPVFEKVCNPTKLYRQTGVVLADLIINEKIQYSLFDDPLKIEKVKSVFLAVDELSARFGKHTISLGSTLPVKSHQIHQGERGDIAPRKKIKLRGETARQRINLPYFFTEI